MEELFISATDFSGRGDFPPHSWGDIASKEGVSNLMIYLPFSIVPKTSRPSCMRDQVSVITDWLRKE